MVWDLFIQEEQLTAEQAALFKKYKELLIEWNEKSNLTRIIDEQAIVQDHFQDSIKLREFIDFTTINGIADVGTGAGFPGIPLKIMFPHLQVILIEVNLKKMEFLEHVCQELDLEQMVFSTLDWRTFLRTTNYPIDLVCARASLTIDELLRMFKPASSYKNASLIYWASKTWHPTMDQVPYVEKEGLYIIGAKERRYIFFKNPILAH